MRERSSPTLLRATAFSSRGSPQVAEVQVDWVRAMLLHLLLERTDEAGVCSSTSEFLTLGVIGRSDPAGARIGAYEKGAPARGVVESITST